MKYKFILFPAFFFLPLSLFAQIDNDIDDFSVAEEASPTLFQSLDTDPGIPKIILTTDLKKILKNKLSPEKLSAKVEMTRDGQNEVWNIELEARGKSRKRICDFPPLRITFSKDDLNKKGMRKKHNSLKLVSYCKNRDNYENYTLREYVAYKMYNMLTDYSFRVQLVQIEYRDALNRISPVTRYGILLEDADELAERLNAKEKSKYEFGRDSLDHFQYDILTLYQYMISNTDWKIRALHNIKLIRDKDSAKYYAIPYDFDYSGFVNAEYAMPNPDYRQTHVTERIYLGECRSVEELASVRELFLNKKAEILATENKNFTDKEHEKMMKAINSFYKILESDKLFKRKCLKERWVN